MGGPKKTTLGILQKIREFDELKFRRYVGDIRNTKPEFIRKWAKKMKQSIFEIFAEGNYLH